MTPIQIFHITHGYRVFSRYWWQRLLAYPFAQFWRDLYQAYHRMRYGWAPRDVWNLDGYLDRVLADTLLHLANTTGGSPSGYPFKKNPPLDDDGSPITDHEQWTKDLIRWSNVFDECAAANDIALSSSTGWQQRETFTERRTRVLNEMSYWWDGLWD